MEGLDVIVVGAGANGLVCAIVLARAGLRVHVLEDRPAVGGGCRTEYPFTAAPRLAASTGSHRIGFVPPDLLRQLGLTLPTRPRDPATFVPTTTPGGYLLAGPGHAGFREGGRRHHPQGSRRQRRRERGPRLGLARQREDRDRLLLRREQGRADRGLSPHAP
jgi:phytoene dehydrogenase-like protein